MEGEGDNIERECREGRGEVGEPEFGQRGGQLGVFFIFEALNGRGHGALIDEGGVDAVKGGGGSCAGGAGEEGQHTQGAVGGGWGAELGIAGGAEEFLMGGGWVFIAPRTHSHHPQLTPFHVALG